MTIGLLSIYRPTRLTFNLHVNIQSHDQVNIRNLQKEEVIRLKSHGYPITVRRSGSKIT